MPTIKLNKENLMINILFRNVPESLQRCDNLRLSSMLFDGSSRQPVISAVKQSTGSSKFAIKVVYKNTTYKTGTINKIMVNHSIYEYFD